MSSRGKIDVYLDCNSPYSYFAFTWLKRNQELLAEHGVDVEYHPIFLGGLNAGSGNKPPWTLPAKAAYSAFDGPRAQKYFQTMPLQAPSFFPILSLLPMRCMLYIKSHYPASQYEEAFGELWKAYWRDHLDLSKRDCMAECLRRHFGEGEVREILEAGTSAEYKKLLTEETGRLVERGAFGAPWFFVRDKVEGKTEPFFGSDRFAFMLQYLGVPFRDVEILPAAGKAKL